VTDAWTEKLDELARHLEWLREQIYLQITVAGQQDLTYSNPTRHAMPRGEAGSPS